MRKWSLLFLFLITFSQGSLIAQERTVTHGNFQWLQYYNQTQFAPKWKILFDASYRWGDGFQVRSQYLVRAGFNYTIANKLNAAVGFAHFGFYGEDGLRLIEYRPYQEFRYSHGVGKKTTLTHRFRAEQRFFKEVIDGETQGSNTFNHRFRYLFMFNIPLSNPAGKGLKISMYAGNEILLNAGKDIIYNTFGQNRILVGPGFQFNKNLEVTTLYHGMFGARNSPGQYVYFNILWVGIRHRLQF